MPRPWPCSAASTAAGRTSTSASSRGCWRSSGYEVDVFTRRDRPDLPDVVAWADGARIIHVPAGPAAAGPQGGPAALHGRLHRLRAPLLPAAAGLRPDPRELLHVGAGRRRPEARRGRAVRRHVPRAGPGPQAAPGRGRRLPRASGSRSRTASSREADRIIAECPQDEDDLIDLYGADPVAAGDDPLRLRPGRVLARSARRGRGDARPRPGRADRPATRPDGAAQGRRQRDPRPGPALRAGHGDRGPPARRRRRVGRRPTRRSRPRSAACGRSPREEGVDDAVTFVGSRGRDAAPLLLQRGRRLRHHALVRAVRHHAGRGDRVRHAGRRRGRRRDQDDGRRRRDRLPRPARRPRRPGRPPGAALPPARADRSCSAARPLRRAERPVHLGEGRRRRGAGLRRGRRSIHAARRASSGRPAMPSQHEFPLLPREADPR